ncbi:TPA: ATP-binding protein [Patescibacteria group bacterium]|uniref:ABC transporter domain-containing protein n=1 Tax=Candidatus Gottesmanbacteria bacterium GW2011_GWA1_43_11 TaxID=1618436 RepID=A0A0G1CBA0_9BACT|nr:MAG: hypothetical protein UV59_C0053G0014 [Candidatus Gottesmanbacteria bacterium GW2011_GWA1_43_11]HCS78706.1 ATP-binding protein [Patescibacteria group bacterium]
MIAKNGKKSSRNTVAVQLTNVSKRYTIHHEKPTLVEHLINGRTESFWALKNINLTIKKGEKVGIIGPNGSGKTTLLKIISGITFPTSGRVETFGKTISLIDLEAGFHPDLTGYQNIFLNAMVLGMKRKEIESKIKDIISFADIGKFIDVPLFTYSEGMKLRLGFSIAVHAEPEILILDENMSAGDANFHQKAQAKIQEFFKSGKTIIIVSHWLDYVRENCERVVLLRKGIVEKQGNAQVVKQYGPL